MVCVVVPGSITVYFCKGRNNPLNNKIINNEFFL